MSEVPYPRFHVKDVETQRALDEIMRILESLREKLPGTDIVDSSTVRVVESSGSYYLEVRHGDGWVRTGALTYRERSEA